MEPEYLQYFEITPESKNRYFVLNIFKKELNRYSKVNRIVIHGPVYVVTNSDILLNFGGKKTNSARYLEFDFITNNPSDFVNKRRGDFGKIKGREGLKMKHDERIIKELLLDWNQFKTRARKLNKQESIDVDNIIWSKHILNLW